MGVAVAGTYGTVTINANGSYTYTLDNADAQTQALAQGQSVDGRVQLHGGRRFGATDRQRSPIHITGTNDGPRRWRHNAGDAVGGAGVNPGNTAFPAMRAPPAMCSPTTPMWTPARRALTVAAVNGVAGNVGRARWPAPTAR